MSRAAIFVDAGYLYAQGSTALSGSKKARTELKLNETAALAELQATADARTANVPLLRVYWYDGAVSYRGPTLEQEAIARASNVKLRLGFVNSQGQQKGVDSLIVTDLIDLARNRAISDAVLMSGDEDVRIGVQIAQSFGVRVHLIGIEPSRGSQSKQLLFEADTTTEWDRSTVSKFLSIKMSTSADGIGSPSGAPILAEASGQEPLQAIVLSLAGEPDTDQIAKLIEHWKDSPSLPPDYDGKLLARSRDKLGRNLDASEKRLIRRLFKAEIQRIG